MALYYDNRGRALTAPQLAAIFARAKSRGISEKEVNKKNVITSLNDEIRLAQSRGENDYKKAVDSALTKIYKPKISSSIDPTREALARKKEEIIKEQKMPSGFSNEVIRRMAEKQQELERKQKILIQVGKLQDERADLLQKQIEKTTKSEIDQTPVLPPGLAAGLDPLQRKMSESVRDKIRRRALDIEILEGKSPQVSMDQAKREVAQYMLND